MSVVQIARGGRPHHGPHPEQSQSEIAIHCRLFGQGREDWNRGLREPRGTIVHNGWLSRLPDGSICLHGLPSVDLRLDSAQIKRIQNDGLRIAGTDFEVEIDAASFRAALSSLPNAGSVIPFPRRR